MFCFKNNCGNYEESTSIIRVVGWLVAAAGWSDGWMGKLRNLE